MSVPQSSVPYEERDYIAVKLGSRLLVIFYRIQFYEFLDNAETWYHYKGTSNTTPLPCISFFSFLSATAQLSSKFPTEIICSILLIKSSSSIIKRLRKGGVVSVERTPLALKADTRNTTPFCLTDPYLVRVRDKFCL